MQRLEKTNKLNKRQDRYDKKNICGNEKSREKI